MFSQSKLPLFFSVVSFLAVIFMIFADNLAIVSNISAYSVMHGKEEYSISVQRLTISHITLRSTEEEVNDRERGRQSALLPPSNLTEEERIAWFRKKLPHFEILESNNLTQKFHGRVLEYLNLGCEVQFFMTWIAPAASFGRRELLAVESLFKANHNACLIILSKSLDSAHGYRILKPLLDRSFKILAVAPDLPFLFRNTPAEAWFSEIKKGNKDPGEISLAQNLSNLIRLAVLYKYGGVYLDTDFIVLKSFKGLRNTIGAQSIDVATNNWTRLNNAVLIFDINHPLLLKFMEEFAATFNGNKWGHNGPYLVSRVAERMQSIPSYNFTVFPPMAFYPVSWTRIGGLFRKPENRAYSRWVEAKLLQLNGETYAVHLWNRHSSRLTIEEGSVLERLIVDHCIVCEHIVFLKKIPWQKKLQNFRSSDSSSSDVTGI